MKIALFIPSLDVGGAERVILNLANGFTERGYLVDLLLCKRQGNYTYKVSNKINVINFNKEHTTGALLELIKYIWKFSPDVVISALDYVNIVVLIAKLFCRRKTRFIVSVHSNLSQSTILNNNIKNKMIPFFIKVLYRFADRIVAVSRDVAEDLSRIIGNRKKINVVYNPIVSRNLYIRAKEPLEHKWFKDINIPVILSVGRLSYEKNLECLIKAFKIILQKIDVRLVILGEGNMRQNLKKMIEELKLSEFVDMPGVVENPYNYMKNASVVVLSSKYEGLPNVLIEALACNTPIVSTDCKSGPREILADGRFGYLVQVDDENNIAKRVIDILSGKEVKFTQIELDSHLKQFTLDYAVDEYLKLISEV